MLPKNGGKGSYGDRNYRRGRGGRNDRRPKREPYVPQVAPDREQKNDAAGVSVYGKKSKLRKNYRGIILSFLHYRKSLDI